MKTNALLRCSLASTYHRMGDDRTAAAYALTSMFAVLACLAGAQ